MLKSIRRVVFELSRLNVSGFIDVYGGDMEDLTHEVYQVKKLLQRTKPVPD